MLIRYVFDSPCSQAYSHDTMHSASPSPMDNPRSPIHLVNYDNENFERHPPKPHAEQGQDQGGISRERFTQMQSERDLLRQALAASTLLY